MNGRIKLALPRGLFREVDAEIVGPLAVHEGSNSFEFGLGKFFRGWTISHVATGYKVCGATSKAAGIKFARELLNVADWNFTKPNDVKKFDRETLSKIHAIRARASGDAA